MKFKYKKMVVMISMGTMLIGCVIFSTVNTGRGKAETERPGTQTEVTASPDPTQTPAVDTGVIQKDLEPKVTEIVKEYLTASVACDMTALEGTVNDISLIREDELKLKYEHVEGVQNVECYMVPGSSGDGYLVYAYRELKLKGIDTLAPGLSRVYVKVGGDGEYRVFFGADTGLEDFINATDQSDEVTELVEKVNTKMEEALSSDQALKAFVDGLTTSGSKK